MRRQLEDCLALAERLGFDVSNGHSDNDIGASRGSPKSRPRYDEMLRTARAGKFSVIIGVHDPQSCVVGEPSHQGVL